MRQQFTNFRTVLRDEGRRFVEIFYVHNCGSSTFAMGSFSGQ
jgi:hypothetical protein